MTEKRLATLIGDLAVDAAIAEGKALVAAGAQVLDLQSEIIQGLRIVGDRYSDGQCYIADLMVAGMIARELFALAQTGLQPQGSDVRGKVVIGTIYGDIHDIGKDLIADTLRYRGVDVIDLGVDVPVDAFLGAAQKQQPDILAISTIMDNSFANIKALIAKKAAYDLPADLKLVVGGAAADERYVSVAGVDCLTNDYQKGIFYCLDVLHRKYDREASEIE